MLVKHWVHGDNEPMKRILFCFMALFPLVVAGQELTPRAYWPAPQGTQVLTVGALYTDGDIIPDPSLPITGVDSQIATGVVGYLHTVNLFGRTGNLVLEQAYSMGETTVDSFDFGVVELQVPVSTLQVFDQGLERIELRPVQNGNLPPVAGELDTIVRTLTDNTRLATVRVRVDRPLQHPGWTYGMHLQADIVAKQIRNLAYIPSDLVVSGNLVWILRQGRATRHQVTPVGNSGRVVSVLENFAPGDELILERPIGLFDGAEVAVAALADFGPEALAGMGR